MDISDFKKENVTTSEFELKDGRIIYTTHNGFRYWIATAKGIVSKVSETYYRKAKQHIFTKKNSRV